MTMTVVVVVVLLLPLLLFLLLMWMLPMVRRMFHYCPDADVAVVAVCGQYCCVAVVAVAAAAVAAVAVCHQHGCNRDYHKKTTNNVSGCLSSMSIPVS